MKNIERFIALLECKTEETWKNSIFQLGNEYGFEQILIAVSPDRPTSLSDTFLRSNYAPQWLSSYDNKRLFNIDPTVAHCVASSTPLIWDPSIFANQKQKEMYEEAAGFGLRSGITLPYHGANGELGILCFANDVRPGKRSQQHALYLTPLLSMMRDFAFESVLRFTKKAGRETPPTLSARELECMNWCAKGKTSWEIAKILNCSERAVNAHFEMLRLKFNVSTRRAAVVKAMNFGLLHL